MQQGLAALLLALGAALPAAADDATIVTARNTSIAAREIQIESEGGKLVVKYTDPTGSRQTLPADEVVEIVLGPARIAGTPRYGADDVEITLTTGDLLIGRLGAKSADGVLLQSKVYGNPVVKFDHVRSILFPANRGSLPKSLPAKAEKDEIYKKSGDRSKGTLQGVSTSGVEYYSEVFQKDMVEPLTQVAGILLAELKSPPKEPSSLFTILLTADGSSLRGQVGSLKEGVLSFTDIYGTTYRIPANEVAGFYLKNGRVVYLSDVEPASAQEDANFIRGPQKSSSDLDYPFQRDRSAKGTKIVLGGVEHRKGLGVRAHSALTYPLGGTFKRFQSTLGLDAVSMGLGAVTAEVWVDGKRIKEVTLRGTDPPQSLDIDVAGANELRLVVTWAGNGQSDFADWGSARLIR